jgi:hypothetical protein
MKRKQLTLPSGATTTVRALTAMDFAAAGLNRPNTLKDEPETDEPSAEGLAFGFQVTKLALLRACGHFKDKDGKLFKIVDKPHYETIRTRTFTEICFEELDQEDSRAILDAVSELTNLGKEAAQAAESFPEGQPASDPCAPDGESLR